MQARTLGNSGLEVSAVGLQIALAWLLSRRPWIVPIPGTTQRPRLEENNGAANIVLSAADLGAIESALQQIQIIGDRYPAHLQRNVGRLPAESASFGWLTQTSL